jgi:quinol monooxygenase YgiN
MFALVVRFDLRDQEAARRFDDLLAETLPLIVEREPRTLVYAVHQVEDAPLSRVFYEVYTSREALDEHESTEHTRRFLDEKEQYVVSTRVEFLDSPRGKSVANPD